MKLAVDHLYEDESGTPGLCVQCGNGHCMIAWASAFGRPWMMEMYYRDGKPYTENARRIVREIWARR